MRVHGSIPVAAGAVAAAVVLAVVGTWPLATCLDRCMVDSDAPGFVGAAFRRDVDLIVWILAWGAHALVHQPTALFDANVFHPATHALATTEHMLGLQPIHLPLAFATGAPVTAHQATLLATFAGAFLTMLALGKTWTGSWPAAATAGVLYAFSPFRAAHLPALQIEGAWLLPLVVLACERVGANGRRAWVVGLAMALAVQALVSYYVAYASFLAIGVLLAVATSDASVRRHAPRLVAALAAAAAVVAVCSVPYLAARSAGTLPPPDPAFVAGASARLGRTGATLAAVVAAATIPWWRRGLVPGVRPIWLVAIAVAGVVAHVLALGPRIAVGTRECPGPFELVAAIVPGWELVRAPARLNLVTTLAAAILAGVGVAGLARTVAQRSPVAARLVHAAALAAAVVAIPATTRWPVPLTRVAEPGEEPAVYAWLARAPAGPVLELPFHDFHSRQADLSVEAVRMRYSTRHWQPLVGGYSGYVPPSYGAVSALARALPEPRALELLQRTTGVRWIVLHRSELDRDGRRAWRAARSLVRVVAVLGPDVVVTPRAPVDADLVPPLLEHPADVTVLGTARRSLPPADRRATIRMAGIDVVPWLARVEVPVQVTNHGSSTWPAMGSGSHGLVTIGYRWLAVDGSVMAESPDAGRLPWDVAPEETLTARMVVSSPGAPGAARLVVGVAQAGAWFDGTVVRCFDTRGVGVDCPRETAALAPRSALESPPICASYARDAGSPSETPR